jgi:hypothetical protein
VYRPVTQTSQKSLSAAPGLSGAPPVYRPTAATSQLKRAEAPQIYRRTSGAQAGAGAQMNLGAGSPPAYRPQPGRAQPKRTGAPGGAPPAYRPQMTVTQAKPACAKWAPTPYRAERPAVRTTPLQFGTSAVLQLAKSTTLLENLAKPKVLGLSLSHVVMQKDIEHRRSNTPSSTKGASH